MLLPIDIISTIAKATKLDLKYKTPLELWMSAAEEYGELAREIKIEFQVFGNEHKQKDEGILGESIDVFITALCLYCTNDPDGLTLLHISKHLFAQNEKNIFITFREMGKSLYDAYYDRKAALELAKNAAGIYFDVGGTEEEFINYCKKKLEKWIKNQENSEIDNLINTVTDNN